MLYILNINRMKKLTYISLALCCTLLTLGSCNRENLDFDTQNEQTENRPQGQVNLASLRLNVKTQVNITTRTIGATTRAEAVDVSGFLIRIFDRDNSMALVKEWSYGSMPEIFALPVGNYRVAAYSHEEKAAEFDRPFYYGEQDFSIVQDNITEVATIQCTLKSIMVTVEYDEALEALMDDDVQVTVTVGQGTLLFAKGEQRAGYFHAQNESDNLLTAELKGTIDEAMTTMSKGFNQIKAGEHRIVRYTLKGVNEGGDVESGNAQVNVGVDASCTTDDRNVVVDPTEEILPDSGGNTGGEGENPSPASQPTIVGSSFAGAPFDIRQTLSLPREGCELKVMLKAPTGMSSVKVKIVSDQLTPELLSSVGLADEFDLVTGLSSNGMDLSAGLKGLGFPVGSDFDGKTEVLFDISSFTSLLGIYQGTHRFVITVSDKSQPVLSTTETLTILVQ